MREKRGKRYDAAFKREAVRLVVVEKVPYTRAARDLGVAEETLRRWILDACRVRRKLPSEPIIFHSDRGSQYNADVFRTELAKRNFQQSMSGKGNCYDPDDRSSGVPMESFWARMKTELGRPLLFDNLRDARSIVYRWVHVFYNRQRIHSGIKNMTPVQFEQYLVSSSRVLVP